MSISLFCIYFHFLHFLLYVISIIYCKLYLYMQTRISSKICILVFCLFLIYIIYRRKLIRKSRPRKVCFELNVKHYDNSTTVTFPFSDVSANLYIFSIVEPFVASSVIGWVVPLKQS